MPRILRPDLYPGRDVRSPGCGRPEARASCTWTSAARASSPGCPPIHDLWMRGLAWDLWLLGGAVVIGTAGGILAGVWCAGARRSLRARALEAAAMAAYCAPVFFVGLLVLCLFNPIYGRVPLPCVLRRRAALGAPWNAPWDWFRAAARAVAGARRAARGDVPAADAVGHARGDGRGLRAHRGGQGRGSDRRRAPARGAALLSRDVLVRRRLGAADHHEHGAGRADAVGARVLQVHVAGGRAREPAAWSRSRLPAAVRARPVGARCC